jgi:hypothetical protein
VVAVSTPVSLLDDVTERLAVLDANELLGEHALFEALAAESSNLSPPVRRLYRELVIATEAEHHRRRTGDGVRLDGFAEAIGGLLDGDLAEGSLTYARLRDDDKGRLPPAVAALNAAIGQCLLVEGHRRRDERRAFERDALSDRVVGGFGYGPKTGDEA